MKWVKRIALAIGLLFILVVGYGYVYYKTDWFVITGNQDEILETYRHKKVKTVSTFRDTHVYFGEGGQQTHTAIFDFPEWDPLVNQVFMLVRLRCPEGGCARWDTFANIAIKAPSLEDEWWEMGRFITAYGVDNSAREKGFVIDVTDFASLLQGKVALKAFIELWTKEGWLLSVDFDFVYGSEPQRPKKIVPVWSYANASHAIPYGDPVPKDISLTQAVQIPAQAKKAHLRTLITGWGHAQPADFMRRCAEWCYRTHTIKLNGQARFAHSLDALGCSANQVHPQKGNWKPDRAGWCPGMEVPLRTDSIPPAFFGNPLALAYEFEPYTREPETDEKAYYALSTFLVYED